MAMSII